MVSYPRPTSLSQMLDYFVKESQGYNSFVEHPDFAPEFGGGLLSHLGLKPGPFTEEEYASFAIGDFPSVLSGRLKIAYGSDLERAAYDVTVSFPKCFSLQLLVAKDTRLFSVAREANQSAMRLFEEYAVVRRTDAMGRVKKVRVAGIAYASWWHISSRERTPDAANLIGTGADPHFHVHNLISKFVLPADGGELGAIHREDVQLAAKMMNVMDAGKHSRNLRKLKTSKNN